MLTLDDLTNLQSLLERHHANVSAVLDDCHPDGEGWYDCPMCNGEGHVDAEWVSDGRVMDRERLESIGLQVYGIGEDHQAVHLLLRELLRLAPQMADTIRELHGLLNSCRHYVAITADYDDDLFDDPNVRQLCRDLVDKIDRSIAHSDTPEGET